MPTLPLPTKTRPMGSSSGSSLVSGVALNEGHVFPLLIAVALDDHLAIRFPLAFPDDRCFAWLALALLDYGRSFPISVAVIRAYRHSGSDRAHSDTNPDLFRARRYCGAYTCRHNYCQYVLHEISPGVVLHPRAQSDASAFVPTGSIRGPHYGRRLGTWRPFKRWRILVTRRISLWT